MQGTPGRGGGGRGGAQAGEGDGVVREGPVLVSFAGEAAGGADSDSPHLGAAMPSSEAPTVGALDDLFDALQAQQVPDLGFKPEPYSP